MQKEGDLHRHDDQEDAVIPPRPEVLETKPVGRSSAERISQDIRLNAHAWGVTLRITQTFG